MKKFKAVLILMVSLVCADSSAEANAPKIMRKSSPENQILTLLEEPPVRGHTYATVNRGFLDPAVDCGSAITKVLGLLFDVEFFEQHGVYDYAVACVPDAQESFFMAEFIFEPKSQEDAAAVDEYIAKRQGTKWENFEFRFLNVSKIETRKTFEARFYPRPNESAPSFRKSLEGEAKAIFETFTDYKAHIYREAALMKSGDSKSVIQYLQGLYSGTSVERFSEALKKSNYINSSTLHVLVSPEGGKIQGAYYDGTFRECFKEGDGYCLPLD